MRFEHVVCTRSLRTRSLYTTTCIRGLSKHGLYTWPVHMACTHGLYTWPVHMACTHDLVHVALYTRHGLPGSRAKGRRKKCVRRVLPVRGAVLGLTTVNWAVSFVVGHTINVTVMFVLAHTRYEDAVVHSFKLMCSRK
jgi:hypothetical protein